MALELDVAEMLQQPRRVRCVLSNVRSSWPSSLDDDLVKPTAVPLVDNLILLTGDGRICPSAIALMSPPLRRSSGCRNASAKPRSRSAKSRMAVQARLVLAEHDEQLATEDIIGRHVSILFAGATVATAPHAGRLFAYSEHKTLYLKGGRSSLAAGPGRGHAGGTGTHGPVGERGRSTRPQDAPSDMSAVPMGGVSSPFTK